MELSPHECRLIGCLVEKEITTPEQYPLSLNALASACNQKSNRNPVLELDEPSVRGLLDGLIKKRLVSEQSGYGSRVPKFQQLFCNTTFATLRFAPQELAIVCELLLRGAQTPGELRSHASRLCRFDDVSEVEAVLNALARREDGPFVMRLAREPGRREARYVHLFGSVSAEAAPAEAPARDAGRAGTSPEARLDQLERRLAELETEVGALKRRIDKPAGA